MPPYPLASSAAPAIPSKRRKISRDQNDKKDKNDTDDAPASNPSESNTNPEETEETEETAATSNSSPKTFKDLGIVDELCDACESLGYKNPTPIQSQSIPLALQNRDIIGLAETGSGKTAAFALPILQALLEHPQPYFGLVLAPTRELAHQIGQQFEALGSLIAVRCAVIVGGLDMVQQAIALGKKPHIIVASPGRCKLHPYLPMFLPHILPIYFPLGLGNPYFSSWHSESHRTFSWTF